VTPPEIRELVAEDIPAATGLLAHLNPAIPPEVLQQRFETILAEHHPHYHAFGAFVEGKLAAVAGVWLATKIWCGRYLELDNLVVDPDQRSSGLGTALIRHLEAFAREKDCNLAVLDSYTSNHASHRLYHRLGFEIWGFHFVKPFGPLDR
jgi:GNAT superfamily N-acetyltransferase